MFENINIDKYSLDKIPMDRDCYLMSDIHMREFSDELEKLVQGEDCSPYEVGAVAPVAVRKINKTTLELSWYANTFTRFHEVSITLPKDMIKICVGCRQYDVKPYIFVSHEWLEQLHLRQYSIFALIDAIGVKEAIKTNSLSKEKLIKLREAIDQLAEKHADISLISFADSLILKTNWDVGYADKGMECSYRPEKILHIIKEIDHIYHQILGLKIYAVLTQGSNEYYGESLLHISKTNNHVCLNSLGLPFAELLAIETAAKQSIKTGVHPPMQLYLDEQFYLSLNLQYSFEKTKKPKSAYAAIMKVNQPSYYYSTCDELIANFEN